MALWGGFECSVTRIGDAWRDQVRESGHEVRASDLDLAASLGVSALRYPFVWERVDADERGSPNRQWPWHDSRMRRLRRLGLQVIAGLVHHGSGPAQTDLLDPGFGPLLAIHAGRVAERYPDIALWTPVNEPLTTARFSCLYGVWYPHQRDTDLFLRATVNQCYATLLAMRAIRRHVPAAGLMQTEDLGRTFCTRPLDAQAEYENARRWLSLDLLTGRLGPRHPWWPVLLAAGTPARQLGELATGEACPAIIAANYYATSERFLDHRTALYPARLRGGNGRDTYADTEAIRVPMPPGTTGWLPRLREVWDRYRLPMVVGEAHLGGADEAEQARWFLQAWQAASSLRAAGVPMRAVTAWALGGSVDWDSLMQHRRGRREAGAWDYSTTPPRPRLLAALLQGLAREGCFEHPALAAEGWWERNDRYTVRAQRA